jgi:hypothetical protein
MRRRGLTASSPKPAAWPFGGGIFANSRPPCTCGSETAARSGSRNRVVATGRYQAPGSSL